MVSLASTASESYKVSGRMLLDLTALFVFRIALVGERQSPLLFCEWTGVGSLKFATSVSYITSGSLAFTASVSYSVSGLALLTWHLPLVFCTGRADERCQPDIHLWCFVQGELANVVSPAFTAGVSYRESWRALSARHSPLVFRTGRVPGSSRIQSYTLACRP